MKLGCVFLFSVCWCGLPATPPPALKVAGRPVELSLTAISAHTVRITVAPLDLYRTPQPVVEDPVLVPRLWPAPTLRLRSVLPAETVRVGGMEVSVNPEGLSLRLARGNGSDFQEIGINPNDGSVSFRVGTEPRMRPLPGSMGDPAVARCGRRYSQDRLLTDLIVACGQSPLTA